MDICTTTNQTRYHSDRPGPIHSYCAVSSMFNRPILALDCKVD